MNNDDQFLNLKHKVMAHDWKASYPNALIERIDIVRALIELPMVEYAKIMKSLSVSNAAIANQLCEAFIKSRIEKE